MEQPTYKNGLAFDTKLSENIIDIEDRIIKKKAGLLIIDGGVGEGKTTLAVEVADFINSLKGLPPISLEAKDHPQIGLGAKEFMHNLRYCYGEKFPVVIYDEAGDFNKRGALTRLNAMINRVFETFRGFKILVVICLPSFESLDNDLLTKNIPRLLLHLSNREETYGNYSGYSLYRMFYIKDKMKKLVVKSFAYDLVNPNFVGHFKDLSPERGKQLDRLSTKGKIEVLKEQEIKAENLVSYSDIAQKVNRSIGYCRRVILDNRIKHKRLFNRVKYFDHDVIDRVCDIIDGVNEE